MSATLPLADALDRVRDPAGGERAPLVVDASFAADVRPGDAALLRAWPAPTVAWCPADALPAELRDAFDVSAESEAQLALLLEGMARAPLAATALVQLLRLSEGRPVADGLVAESLAYSALQAGPEFAAWLAERDAVRPRAASTGPAVRCERRGDRLRLTLDRPARHNAYSVEMRDALCEGLELAVADDSIHEVVLAGRGASFCSGGDLDEFGSSPDPVTAHVVRTSRSAAALLARCAGRVEARVHGACVGAGVELPAFARRVVAAPDAWFQLPEVGMGLVPGAGGTVSLPRRIGRRRTAWLALTGERLAAHRALEWGLVDALGAP